MAMYRALSRTPAAIAAPVPPPAPSTASEPNWAAPENTMIDITIGATDPHHGAGQHAEGDRDREHGRPKDQPAADPRPSWRALGFTQLVAVPAPTLAKRRPRRSCAWWLRPSRMLAGLEVFR